MSLHMDEALNKRKSKAVEQSTTESKYNTAEFDKKIAHLYSKSDASAKRILSNKHLLAYILKSVVKEFKDMKISDIIPCIGDTENVSVTEDLTNRSTEELDYLKNRSGCESEGFIEFDIYFKAEKAKSKVIINIEAQNKYKPGYDLSRRALFYGCRLISSEKQRIFVNSNYDGIVPVYSIWICMGRPKPSITTVGLTENQLVGDLSWSGCCNLLNLVCIGLTDDPENNGNSDIVRLLSIIFSKKLHVAEKDRNLEEYDINLYKGIEKELCSMSMNEQEVIDWLHERDKEVEEKAESKGIEKGIAEGKLEVAKSMLDNGIGVEDVIKITKLSREAVLSLTK